MPPPKKIIRYLGSGLLALGYYFFRKRKGHTEVAPGSPPRLRSSSQKQERPTLIDFSDLNAPADYETEGLPKLPEDASGRGNYRMLQLTGLQGPSFFVHVYNGSLAELPLQVYGIRRGGEARALLPETVTIAKVAQRVPVSGVKEDYTSFYVRFALGGRDGEPHKFRDTNVISVAVYNQEPVAKGGIAVKSPTIDDPVSITPFSHEENTFQSVVISSCDLETDLKKWGAQSALSPDQAYFGTLGGVMVLGIEPGLSPNTTGTHIRERMEQDTHGGAAGPNYAINQYNPTGPQKLRDCTAAQPTATEPVSPHTDYDSEADPVIVSVIDGGIDTGVENAGLWKPSNYRSSRESEFVKQFDLGYDFINSDRKPEDETSHGTYVAGIIASYYSGSRPLEMLHFRTFGREGISTYFGALVAIYEAATIGSHIINMSWGMYADEAPPAMECAIKAAIRQNCYLIVSAGNDSTDLGSKPQWPAAFAETYPKNVVTVASYKILGNKPTLSDFSNFGAKHVTVAAHESARAPQIGTTDAAFPKGTSISTPLVTAAFATILAGRPTAQIGDLYGSFDRPVSLSGRVYRDSYLVTEADRHGKSANSKLISDCD